jgi:uncharacterized alpha-E superfamily protein
MSRYLERAEHAIRVMDVNLVLMLDQTPAYGEKRWARLLRSLRITNIDPIPDDPQEITEALFFDRSSPYSIVSMLASARDNARQVRNQLSSEVWEQVNSLYLKVNNLKSDDIWGGRSHQQFREIIEGIQLFHGITEATMRHDEGWHFLQVGRYLERANATIALLDAYFSNEEQAPNNHHYLDWVGLLKSRTAFEAYCQVYTADLQAERIAAFLLFNPEFPHSVRFATDQVHHALSTIADLTNARKGMQIERVAGRLHALIAYAQIEEIWDENLDGFLSSAQQQCGHLHSLLQEVYFQPPIEAILPS